MEINVYLVFGFGLRKTNVASTYEIVGIFLGNFLSLSREKNNLKAINVLFVCMGNICRSPTAQGVFQNIVVKQSLQPLIGSDSCGTYAFQAGSRPDPRASRAAAKRGYDISTLTARKIAADDFALFDYVLAMDNENKTDLLKICAPHQCSKVRLFMSFARHAGECEVPDPYYGGSHGFETVLDMAEEASHALLEYIIVRHALVSRSSIS